MKITAVPQWDLRQPVMWQRRPAGEMENTMAIEKNTDLGNGVVGVYWCLSDITRIKHSGGITKASVNYALYLDKKSHDSGLQWLTAINRIAVEVKGLNPSLSDFAAAADVVLTRAAVPAVEEVPAVAAVAAVPAKDGVPKIQAVKAVAQRGAVRAVKGGSLEGGAIV